MGLFALLAVNVSKVIGDFESENIVLAYIDESLSDAEARGLQPQIEAIPNVATATFISREEAFQEFVGKYDDQSRFSGIDASVFRHRFYVYVDDIALVAETTQNLRVIPGIAKVNANLTIARGFVIVRNIVSGASIILISILLVISLFIMSNTIRIATFERREEIAIMKVVGATNSFIRWPFVFEGFILGLLGALFAFVAQWGIYVVVTDAIINSQSAGFIQTIPFARAAPALCAVFVLIGLIVGVIGSSVAIRKYLKV
jgi:cell division transport system permease protein